LPRCRFLLKSRGVQKHHGCCWSCEQENRYWLCSLMTQCPILQRS
jgi:hypothetical protein